jgi:hypothetical protein
MRQRLLHSALVLLPALVLGSVVLPALHRSVQHGCDVTATGPVLHNDDTCALCAATSADEPAPPVTPGRLAAVPCEAGQPALPAGQAAPGVQGGRAPPMG